MPFPCPALARALLAALLLAAPLAVPAQMSKVPGSGSSILDKILGGTGPSHCSNNGAGNPSPCSAGNSPATLTAPPADVGTGNPINLLTGNKYRQEVDLPALPGVLGLEIIRHYNSQYALPNVPTGILGHGWKLSYETDLYVVGPTLQIVQADGTRLIFNRDPKNPSLCSTADPAHGRVRIERKPKGDEYVWRWPNGRQLFFDRQGKLVQILAPTGEFVALTRDPEGLLIQVTDPQGRSLRLNYADRRDPAHFHGVASIDSPVGRFAYAYGSELPKGASLDPLQAKANLVRVAYPSHYDAGQKLHAYANRGVTRSAITREYHYEDARFPTLLTGITVAGTGTDGQPRHERIGTYAYNAAGRAILSVPGRPKEVRDSRPVPGTGIGQVELDFSQPGRTVLTNSLGQKTTYRYTLIAGDYRLLESRGPGCATCGTTNRRYGYDRLGRLRDTTFLDGAGHPLLTERTERDGAGRPVTVSRIAYRNGRAQPGQRQVRYEYAPAEADGQASPQPILIAHPSVVPGQEHQLRITYNAAGQPLSVTETGYAPALPGETPTPIARTTAWRYHMVNGRSLLAEIDGPLPNGPKGDPGDSDVTRFEWDKSGSFIIGWTEAGGRTSTLAYDENTGRLSLVRSPEGFATSFAYGSRNELASALRTSPGRSKPWAVSYKYDALGHRTETGLGDQSSTGYRPQVRQAFDVLGNRLWTASAQGFLQQNKYDTESRLTESGRYSNRMAQVQRYGYDLNGRLTQVASNSGTALALAYAPDGQLQSLTDTLGRVRWQAKPAAASPSDPSSPRQTASSPVRRSQDDFGRMVATISPDAGTETRNFDMADRLIAGTDAQGNHAIYEYDALSRIASQAVFAAHAPEPLVTRWHYDGRRLAALEHPTQSERYRYDERGLPLARIVEVKQAGDNTLTSVTRYAHDEDGALQGISLPDGSRLLFERNGQGQVVAMKRSRIHTTWLQWLLPAKTVVGKIQRDLVGLRSYAAGNGIEAVFQRSGAGVLARVSYRSASPLAAKPLIENQTQALLGIGSAQAADVSRPEAAAVKDSRLPGVLGLVADPQALIDHRYLWDASGNLLHVQDRGQAVAGQSGYAYDPLNRLIAAVQAGTAGQDVSRYYYDPADRRPLSQRNVADQRDLVTNTHHALYQPDTHRWLGEERTGAVYDISGQPQHIGQREYIWDALGRLSEVRQDEGGKTGALARYTYNHRGERIAKTVGDRTTYYLYEHRQLVAELDGQGKITHQYIYLADAPVAVIDTPAGKALDHMERSAWGRIARDLATVAQAWFGDDERIVWLHANHLGAVEAATDEAGHLVWRAAYDPFGQARIQQNGFTLDLRLPGQYRDAETGLHYNGRRYYDPSRGEYLTPDPLGTPDGPNPYAYVRGNPLRYIDPSGLVLFAFDGTGNVPESNTNVSLLLAAYGGNDAIDQQILERENGYYIEGPGTSGIEWLDGAIAYTLRGRIDTQLKNLDDYVKRRVEIESGQRIISPDNPVAITLDIVGFSRGAAAARDFANQAMSRWNSGYYTNLSGFDAKCIKASIRFMGLFDTVLSTAMGSFDMHIPEAVQYAAQAVAVNEHRDLFPLESIAASYADPGASSNRIERGFVGAHSDIGGGYNCQGNGCDGGDLSDVALNWMIEQARNANVPMESLPKDLMTVSNPILHDETRVSPWNLPGFGGLSSDREVRYPDAPDAPGTPPSSRDAPIVGMNNATSLSLIRYSLVPTGNQAGMVDMAAYAEWLRKNNDYVVNINN